MPPNKTDDPGRDGEACVRPDPTEGAPGPVAGITLETPSWHRNKV